MTMLWNLFSSEVAQIASRGGLIDVVIYLLMIVIMIALLLLVLLLVFMIIYMGIHFLLILLRQSRHFRFDKLG